MKRLIFVYSLFVVLASCRQENPTENKQQSTLKTSFDFIEITFDKRLEGITSIYVDLTKTVRVKFLDKSHHAHYFTGQIPDAKLNELNRLASGAINKKMDNVLLHPSDVTISYCLILKQNNKTLKTFVYEDKDYPFSDLRDLTHCLFSLKHDVKENKSDTHFKFRTYEIICNPPMPIMDTIKFIPPVIKDE